MRSALLSLLVAALSVAGIACDDPADRPGAADTASPSATATAAASPEAPAPVRHAFAPGELIDVQDAGIFFVDIETGAAEAWVAPGSADNPFAFRVSGMTADGSKLVYTCAQSGASGLQPCGGKPGDPFANYLFDTKTGDRIRLAAFTQLFVTLSPDGETILGLDDGGALIRSRASRPDGPETITLTDAFGAVPFRADWAPDGEAAILLLGVDGQPSRQAVLVRNDATAAVRLVDAGVLPEWAPDGSKVALPDIVKPGMWVFDERGSELWTKPEDVAGANARWSPDGTSLAVPIKPAVEPGLPERIDIMDATTGETLYRIEAAMACAGRIWNADGSLLLVGSYVHDGHVVVADPAARRFASTDWYLLTPSLDDPQLAILFDAESFHAFDLATQQRGRTIAQTSVAPAWFFDHEPLFAGGRIVFAAPHLGHGGCGEGDGIAARDEPRFEFPPFER